MGFFYTTQMQNQPYPYANVSMRPYFAPPLYCCNPLSRISRKGFCFKMVTLNDVLNKKKNKRNQPKATKKYVIHSNKNVILLQPKVAP